MLLVQQRKRPGLLVKRIGTYFRVRHSSFTYRIDKLAIPAHCQIRRVLNARQAFTGTAVPFSTSKRNRFIPGSVASAYDPTNKNNSLSFCIHDVIAIINTPAKKYFKFDIHALLLTGKRIYFPHLSFNHSIRSDCCSGYVQ